MRYRQECETVAKPATDVCGLLRGQANRMGDKTAYVFLADGECGHENATPPAVLSYAGLDRRARAIAAKLQALGLAGQRALLLYPPGLDYVEAFFGCLYAGVVAVPAYPPTRQHLPRLTAVVNDAGAALAMTTAAMGEKLRVGFAGPRLWLETDTVDDALAADWTPPLLDGDSLAFLQYTSGSTADPKGVMVSHGNLLANQAAIRQSFRHTEDSTIVGWLPLYHDMGLIGNILQTVHAGATAVLMPPMAFLEKPLRWLQAISHYRATTSGGPNFAYALCAKRIRPEQKRGLDLSHWALAFNGSEAVQADTLEHFSEAFADCGFRRESFFPCYGLAESTLFVTGPRRDGEPRLCLLDRDSLAGNRVEAPTEDGRAVRVVACGEPWAGHETLIVHPETRKPCAEREVGEIWVTGPSVAQGYWNRAEESERVFRAEPTPATGRQYLRTGDLGFAAQGQLHITGRIKDLIIIRGRNYHPQDIEHALAQGCQALRQGGCAAFPLDRDGQESLGIAAELSREGLRGQDYAAVFASLRQILGEDCGIAGAELVLVKPGALPKTSSGKLRRHACRQAYLDGTLAAVAFDGVTEAPSAGPTVEADEEAGLHDLLRDALPALPAARRAPLLARFLRTRLARLLKTDEATLPLDLPLRSAGLDSLKAVELKYAADNLLGGEVPLSWFLSDKTLNGLAERLADSLGQTETEEPTGKPDKDKLSQAQKAMWAVHQLDVDSTAYNLHLALRLQGQLEPDVLRQALDALIERHALLRTVYHAEDGAVVLETLDKPPAYFTEVDAAGWPDARLADALGQCVRQGFDLEHGPLLRVALFHHTEAEHTVLFCAHHIAVDLWSLLVFLAELGSAYAALAEGKPPSWPQPAADYQDAIAWQNRYLRSPAAEADWAYWRRQLDGELPVLALPLDHPRPLTPSHLGASAALRLGWEETARLQILAKQQGVTLFTLLLAAYKVFLHRHTHQDELIVGVPASGRAQARFAGVVGLFVNSLPLRTRPRAGLSFADYLEQVRETQLDAMEHQDFPFGLIVERLQAGRDADQWPVFQTLFVLQQAQAGAPDGFATLALGEDGAAWPWGGWQARPVGVPQRAADFDLKLMAAVDGDSLLFSFQYRADLFDPATLSHWSGSFRTLLVGIADDPQARLDSLPVLDELARQRLLDWNATATDYPAGHVIGLFEDWAVRMPDAPALACGEALLDYRELNARCNRLAHALLRRGVRPGAAIAVCAYRSVEMVLALVAVMKAGGAYLPLDPDYPAKRQQAMLEDAGAGLILVQAGLEHRVAGLGRDIWALDAELSGFADCAAENPGVATHGETLAYVLFTSGSTGRPKGVAVPHKGLWNRLLWMREHFAIDATDVILQKTPYTFDVSVWEFFLPLICGAQLVMAGPDDHKEPERLAALVERHRVTTLHFVPSMLGPFLDTPGLERCASLRRVVCSGEALGAELLPRFFARLGAELHNLYGPTEASIDVTAWACAAGETSVPIGRAIANTQIHLLDAGLNPVPVGVPGELHIGGVQLARGYASRPGLTAERFIPDPFGAPGGRLYKTGDLARHRTDGAIEYLGRIDHQVKIRGLRIELGEIEARLKQHPGVQDAVAVAREDSPGDKRLVGYWVGAAQEEVLRGFLKAALPDYMVPAALLRLDAMPLSANGKLDRKALPAPDFAAQFAGQYAAPRNATETLLAEIWAGLLRVGRVGIHDNFFALGGDSILAIQVASRASQKGLAITPRQMFQHQTVAALAAVAATATGAGHEADNGPAPLTPIQAWFFAQNLAQPQHWNQAVWLEAKQPIDLAALARAVDYWVSHHDALRSRFQQQDGTWRQTGLTDAPQTVFHSVEPDGATDRAAWREAECRRWQASLSLDEGPLLRAVWLDGRLLVLIHHLVVDGVSWRILLDDLQTAYLAVTRGETPALPAKTLAFNAWARQVQALADSDALNEERAYWKDALAGIPGLPVDFPDAQPHEDGIVSLRVELGEAQTHALLRQAHAAYHTDINDLLLAALARTLADWSGQTAVVVDVEGHGRDLLDEADVSRTVGWFTSLYPQALRLPANATPGAAIKAVKAQLRAVPRKGAGYGVLRYLAEADVSASPARILFNYLGQTDLDAEAGPFALLDEPAPFCRAAGNAAAYPLEIIAQVSGHSLRLEWRYADAAWHGTTIARLAENYLEQLRGLIEHCLSPEAGGFSPADFPWLAASAEELAALPYDPRDIEDIYPLSPMQEGMLFDTLMAPHSGIYLMQDRFALRGPVDPDLFQRAWQRLVDRQPALRASFDWSSLARPCQIVHRHVTLPFEFFDWRGLDALEQQARLDSLLEAERAAGFDFHQPPLMAIRLIRLDEDRHCFVRSYHHILVDAWCMSPILTELNAHYAALLQGFNPALPDAPRFADYIGWLQGRDDAAAQAFWRTYLDGFTDPTPLVVDNPTGKPGDGSVGDAIAFLSAEETQALSALAQQQRVTPNTFIQAAWALLLARYSGRDDVVFGVTVAGRPAELRGSESMLGVFINSLPLRVPVPPQQSLPDFLQELLRQNLEIRQFEHTPLVQIQAWSGLPRERALFESLLVFENYPVDPSLRSGAGALNLTGVETRTHSNYPLNAMVIPGERLHLQITYHHDRFEAEAVERMLAHFQHLLKAMIADPGKRLGEFSVLTDTEATQMLVGWNQTAHVYPEPCDIVGQFDAWAARTPEAVCANCDGERLTYRELQVRADAQALALTEAGIGPDDVVALLEDRGLGFLTLMLGVFKAGAAYLPLDPAQPDGRLAQVLEESHTGRLLAGSAYLDRAQAILAAMQQPPKLSGPAAPKAGLNPPARRHRPANLAFIIFTSGSTGTPKGAMVEHLGMYNNLITKVPELDLTAADVIAQTAGQCFDISVWQHLTPLAIGGRVAIYPDEVAKDPGRLLARLEEDGVTILETVPSMIQALLDFADSAALPRLRWLLACGEAFPPALCRRWMERFPHTQVLNAYGPAECSDDVSYYRVPAPPGEADRVVPVGRPVDNTRLYLLDRWLNPVPVGVPGEICVTGIQVGRGYLRRPELTAAAFVPAPFDAPGERMYRTGDVGRYRADGVIEFLGRVDHQLKIRGFRVEPAEIEAQILRHPAVEQVCVLACDDGRGALRLVAYVAHGGKPEIDAHALSDSLRGFLAERLPVYMLPAAFVWLDVLPVSANGKIDRKALPALDIAAETEDRYLAPRTPTEEILVQIWEEVLGVRRVGVRDTFFELGGHSLLAVQVLSRVRAAFDIEMPLRVLFESATIEELAERVEQTLIEQLEALSEEDALALLEDGP